MIPLSAKIATDKGWKAAGEIISGDMVLSLSPEILLNPSREPIKPQWEPVLAVSKYWERGIQVKNPYLDLIASINCRFMGFVQRGEHRIWELIPIQGEEEPFELLGAELHMGIDESGAIPELYVPIKPEDISLVESGETAAIRLSSNKLILVAAGEVALWCLASEG